jgi:UDP-glucose 4-epimerase
MKVLVTGAAGFIGSHLTDRLLIEGFDVAGFDNFSTGRERFLQEARQSRRFTMVRGDLLDATALARAMNGCELVFHLAANADVRFGLRHPRRDLEQNTVATANVLECMRENNVRRIVFASTGSVYGEPALFPTPEDAPFPMQTSLYAASKVAAEGLISAYCVGYGFRSSASATRMVTSSTSTGSCARTPGAWMCSETASNESHTCTWAIAWKACSPRFARPWRR